MIFIEEIWKDIIGFEGLYMVSNLGNIKRYAKTWKSGRNGNQIKSLPESPVKTRISSWGYEVCTLHKDGKKITKRVHVIVAQAFIYNDDVLNKKQVNHIDGNKLNNKADNLEWCTASENVLHSWHVIKTHDSPSFDMKTRIEIWEKYKSGYTVLELVKEYDSTYPYIYNLTVLREKYDRKSFKVNRLSNEDPNNLPGHLVRI